MTFFSGNYPHKNSFKAESLQTFWFFAATPFYLNLNFGFSIRLSLNSSDGDGIYIRRRFVCPIYFPIKEKSANQTVFIFNFVFALSRTDDRMLRCINGEWANVNAKCKRQKSLGYYDDNDDDTYLPDQLDEYSYGMGLNDDIDDEDDCSPQNRRPDLFWMGDGFHNQVCRMRCSTPASIRRHRMHQQGDGSVYDEEPKIGETGGMLHGRYPTFSAITLVGKAINDDGRSRSVRFLPQSPPLRPTKPPMHRGYHPYSRPGAAVAAPTTTYSRAQVRGNPAIQSGIAKCNCCKGHPAVAPVNRIIEVEPVQIQVQKTEKFQKAEKLQEAKQIEHGPSSSTGATTTAEAHQKPNESVQKIENNDQTYEPERPKYKYEDFYDSD